MAQAYQRQIWRSHGKVEASHGQTARYPRLDHGGTGLSRGLAILRNFLGLASGAKSELLLDTMALAAENLVLPTPAVFVRALYT